jgi:uncharacterized protein
LLLLLSAGLCVLPVAAQARDALLEKLARNKPNQLVNDYAGVMSSAQRDALERTLADLSRKTGAQVAVVSLPSLEGGEVNDFANRLFEKWGIGQKGKDNGVLLLAAVNDRKVRIEVGFGLESLLPDAKTGRILDEYVIPRFKQNRYGDGLEAGALALAGIIAGQSGVALQAKAPRPVPAQRVQQPQDLPGWVIVFVVIVIILIALSRRSVYTGPYYHRSSSWGGGGFSSGRGGGFGGGMSGGGGASRSW